MAGDHAIEYLLGDMIGAPIPPDAEAMLCPLIHAGKVPAFDLPYNNDKMIICIKIIPLV